MSVADLDLPVSIKLLLVDSGCTIALFKPLLATSITGIPLGVVMNKHTRKLLLVTNRTRGIIYDTLLLSIVMVYTAYCISAVSAAIADVTLFPYSLLHFRMLVEIIDQCR